MKLKEGKKEAIITGDIKDDSVSVDQVDFNKVIGMLTNNMYSKPIESFIRETVSNAWDSHVEAGCDDPVILQIGKEEDNYFCRIQDFGVGLSKERVEKIYKKIGKTTKDKTNDQLGGFGIGRFSAVAYAPKAIITSVYDGIKSKYQMYKDGIKINISDLYEEETEERNGVEVLVYLNSYMDVDKFVEAIRMQLPYFENVYLDIDNSIDRYSTSNLFNELKIKKYNNFHVNSMLSRNGISILLGKVLYPLRFDNLSVTNKNYPIALKFDIGDLEIVPNREEIIYSSDTIKTIESKLILAYKEIDELIEKETSKDFSNLDTYLNSCDECKVTLLKGNIFINVDSSKVKYTYNGEFYNHNDIRTLRNRICYKTFKYNYFITPERISVAQTYSEFYLNEGIKVLICNLSGINNLSKKYLRETYPNFYVIRKKPSRLSFIKSIVSHLKYKGTEVFHRKKEFKIVLEDVISKLNLVEFDCKNIPESWIKKEKRKQKEARSLIKRKQVNWKENVKIFTLRKGRSYDEIVADGETYSLQDLKDSKKLNIVFPKNEHDKASQFYNIFKSHPNLRIIEIAPSKIKLVENINNFIKYQKMGDIIKYKSFRRLATCIYIQDKFPEINDLAKIGNLERISVDLSNTCAILSNYINKYCPKDSIGDSSDLVKDIVEICEEKDYYDEDIKALFDSKFETLNKARFLIEFSALGRYSYNSNLKEEHINLLVDYILSRKLFRPSLEAVKKVKKETIYNIKEEENENN